MRRKAGVVFLVVSNGDIFISSIKHSGLFAEELVQGKGLIWGLLRPKGCWMGYAFLGPQDMSVLSFPGLQQQSPVSSYGASSDRSGIDPSSACPAGRAGGSQQRGVWLGMAGQKPNSTRLPALI